MVVMVSDAHQNEFDDQLESAIDFDCQNLSVHYRHHVRQVSGLRKWMSGMVVTEIMILRAKMVALDGDDVFVVFGAVAEVVLEHPAGISLSFDSTIAADRR